MIRRVYKPIRLDVHALKRMTQRGISLEQVRSTVRQPDVIRPARDPGAKRLEKRISASRRLCIIAEETEREIWIITAWWM